MPNHNRGFALTKRDFHNSDTRMDREGSASCGHWGQRDPTGFAVLLSPASLDPLGSGKRATHCAVVEETRDRVVDPWPLNYFARNALYLR